MLNRPNQLFSALGKIGVRRQRREYEEPDKFVSEDCLRLQFPDFDHTVVECEYMLASDVRAA